MKNVSFINHIGSTLRVSNYQLLYIYYILSYIQIIKVITGRVELQGPVKFYSNNAVGFDGGAIYLLSYSQLLIQSDTQLEFVNNTGRSVLLIYCQVQIC